MADDQGVGTTDLNRMLRGVFVVALVSALGYLVMIVVSDGAQVAAALRSFPPGLLFLMLMLSLGCYVLRGLRWGLLMSATGYRVSARDAVYLQMSGQTMSVSPGRLGEALKAWLSREITGMPMSRGVALVFAERVADLIAVCLLSLGGLSVVGASPWAVAGAFAVVFAGTVVIGSGWFHERVLRLIARGRFSKHHGSAIAASETVRIALSLRTLWWSSAVSVFSWGLEGVGFALCLRALGFEVLSIPHAVSIYAVSTILGAFTFLPGGIGLTEASMAGMLIALGMPVAAGSAATLITRATTLWWGVVLGWVVLLLRPRLFRRLFAGEVSDLDASAGGNTTP